MSRLEQTIAKRERAEKAAARKSFKIEAREEAKKKRAEKAKFRADFKVMFAKMRTMVKFTFDKYHDGHAIFMYKDEKYSIGWVPWEHKGHPTDVDDYDESGMRWALCKWVGGWTGTPYSIVYDRELNQREYEKKPVKDWSDEAIRVLREIGTREKFAN